ncbi:FtsK/SpoIIIE domain-containing protein [Sanguibacter suarezii]|uniref:FtsK/SpoIIIE domain-containing protein n=1 Tax=Sanguibacter suarezii TaxID=60921 RepID=UPI001C3F3F25|nr:FtsK/SpoIIIE domain-containing protein [Sanguibacter suarezii]
MHPGQHVHLAHARPLGELRAELAACTGRPELARSPLYVDDRRLDDHHVVGQPPLLAGATLRTSPGPCPTPELALAAPVHLAVLTGPGAGDLIPLDVGAPVTPPGVASVRVRVRPGRHGSIRVGVRGDGARVSLTAPDGRAASRLHRRGTWGHGSTPVRPSRPAPWRRLSWLPWLPWLPWQRWRTGHLLTVEDRTHHADSPVTVELRERPVLAEWTCSAMLAALDSPAGRPSTDSTRPSAGMLLAALVPAIVSITLAVVLRNPLFAIMALTAPLMLLGPVLARRRHASDQHSPVSALRRSWDSPWGRAALRAGVPAADLLTAAAACAALPSLPPSPSASTGLGAGPVSVPDRSAHLGTGGRQGDLPGGRPGELSDGLAVIGPRGPASALVARMVLSVHATGRGQSVTVLCDPGRRAAWSWVRWLPGAGVLAPSVLTHLDLASGPGRLLVVDRGDLPELAARLGGLHTGHPGQAALAALILVVDDVAAVPSWCSARAHIQSDARAGGPRVLWSAPGTADETTPVDGVHADWAEAYARRVAALHHRGRWPPLSYDGHGPRVGNRGWGLAGAGPGATHLSSRSSESSALGVTDPAHLPRHASLVDVPGIDDVARRWRDNGQGPVATGRRPGETGGGREHLEARIGVGPGRRTVSIDLLRDGPHALVAGTTGSGKSELLQTLILTLALAYSPDELAVALVDYKGGASFGVCAHLPHVVGQVTDLDPGAAERALTGLRAELRRRERLFAEVDATDLAAYRAQRTGPRGGGRGGGPGGSGDGGSGGGGSGGGGSGGGGSGGGEPLPRLLIVVDEFRAMAEDHPDFIPGLVRIAAQGRSLGIHLVLATQRPGGAITADMRANISLRIALRVSSPADSRDVIDAPDAADIPGDRPGRAVIRRGSGAPELLQTYLAAGQPALDGPGVWHSPDHPQTPDLRVGPVPARSLTAPSTLAGQPGAASVDRACGDDGDDGVGGMGPVDGDAQHLDPAGALVASAVSLAASLGIGRPRVPWSPPLPTDLRWEELGATAPGPTTLLFGLADHPREQRHRPVGWPLSDGHLLILGRAGSGRTTALRTLARAALSTDLTVHLMGPPDLTAGFDPGDPQVGTRVPRTDPRRVARLLRVLTAPVVQGARAVMTDDRARHLVLVDGVEDLLSALGGLHRGDGVDLFLAALREGPACGVVFALAGAVLPSSTLAALVRHRLTLAGRDKHDDTYLGIPASLAGLGGSPGRAVLVTGEEPVLCQVARAEIVTTVRQPSRSTDHPGDLSVRIEEVPFPGQPSRLRAPGPGLVLLGRGGDDAGPVWVRGDRSLLVCGPHGSGRSRTLDHLLAPSSGSAGIGAGAGAGAGVTVLGVVSRDPRLAAGARALGDVPTLERLSPTAAERFVAEVTDRLRSHPAATQRLVIDDLDAFALSCPGAAEALWMMVEDSGAARVTVLASSTTVAAAGAFRGALAELRAARFGVVLSPATPGSSEVFGTDLAWHVEPGVHHPGRGVLVDGSSSTFVQVTG